MKAAIFEQSEKNKQTVFIKFETFFQQIELVEISIK